MSMCGSCVLGSSICNCMRVPKFFVFDVFIFISWCVVYNLHVPCSSRKQHDSNQKMLQSLFKFRLNLEGLCSLLGAVSAADPWDY